MHQLTHYDVDIPLAEQPVCPKCGNFMHIRISPRSYVAEWACLSSDCTGVITHVSSKHIDAIAKAGWPICRRQGM